jgi:hypothetical protein
VVQVIPVCIFCLYSCCKSSRLQIRIYERSFSIRILYYKRNVSWHQPGQTANTLDTVTPINCAMLHVWRNQYMCEYIRVYFKRQLRMRATNFRAFSMRWGMATRAGACCVCVCVGGGGIQKVDAPLETRSFLTITHDGTFWFHTALRDINPEKSPKISNNPIYRRAGERLTNTVFLIQISGPSHKLHNKFN